MNNSKSNKRHLLSIYCAPRLMSNALHAMYLIILIINLKVTLLWSPFYRWENWGSKRLTVLSKVTQLVRTVTRSQAALISELLFLSQCTLKGLKQLIREESKLVCWEWRSLDCVSVQFSSVAQSCPTLCDPMNRSTPDLPVHKYSLFSYQFISHPITEMNMLYVCVCVCACSIQSMQGLNP